MYSNAQLKEQETFEDYHVLEEKVVPSISQGVGSREYGVWFLLLFSLFVLDGIFTYVGISLSSTEFEANLLIRNTMESMGVGKGLLLSKICSVLALLVLWVLRKDIIWVLNAVRGLVFIYLTFAIIPWSFVLVNILFIDYSL